MRIQIELETEIMRAVRSIAAERRLSLGKVISDLLRDQLLSPPTDTRNGFQLFRSRVEGAVVTNEHIDSIKHSGLSAEFEDDKE